MNLGFPEMLFIFVLALLIFGPKKLPDIGRQIGKAMTEFRRASNQFQAQLEVEVRDLEHTADLQDPLKTTPAVGNVPHETAAVYGSASSAAAAAETPAGQASSVEAAAPELPLEKPASEAKAPDA